MDQGQIHAEKRSDHVHSPLIGGESALRAERGPRGGESALRAEREPRAAERARCAQSAGRAQRKSAER
jgi:hypothetical protein